MLQLPKSLYPFHDPKKDSFIVPNIAVGKVKLKNERELIPVFSCFFSHVCFLPSNKWKLIEYTKSVGDGETKSKICHVFIDPASLFVFRDSTVSFFSDSSKEVNIVHACLEYTPMDQDIVTNDPCTPEKPPEKPWSAHPAHWKAMGERYKQFYDILRNYKFEKPSNKAKSKQDELCKELDKLTVHDEQTKEIESQQDSTR